MEETGADFTMTFRQLGEISLADISNPQILNKYWSLKKLSSHEQYSAFTEAYLKRIEEEKGWYQISYCFHRIHRNWTKDNFQFKLEGRNKFEGNLTRPRSM
jgi:hypothetical protein